MKVLWWAVVPGFIFWILVKERGLLRFFLIRKNQKTVSTMPNVTGMEESGRIVPMIQKIKQLAVFFGLIWTSVAPTGMVLTSVPTNRQSLLMTEHFIMLTLSEERFGSLINILTVQLTTAGNSQDWIVKQRDFRTD